ncbi:hypothetical protein A2997_01355 [Candidatus Nomurabacteria bacterium RIFCSPLOWO2_01_FULL_36_10b]|uniref:Uncharacterized protein n=1 Tax=Candidatus Nomurabacteria bacterium RIFCSPLOWO2_01_FULL_36_10b TaxID=1801766 RepID=A0A1F6WQV2_9BACT|nr:MAG: hypothetical protein A2997_01355 [Candidatus Nomurabacteria bacterium RIFCSPLOWO2_01_FULL_36_10b]
MLEEIKEIFTGRHTVFGLFASVAGGSLMSRVLYDWLDGVLHKSEIFFIGLLLFILGGLFFHTFHQDIIKKK